jgi:hypothetical protein
MLHQGVTGVTAGGQATHSREDVRDLINNAAVALEPRTTVTPKRVR